MGTHPLPAVACRGDVDSLAARFHAPKLHIRRVRHVPTRRKNIHPCERTEPVRYEGPTVSTKKYLALGNNISVTHEQEKGTCQQHPIKYFTIGNSLPKEEAAVIGLVT